MFPMKGKGKVAMELQAQFPFISIIIPTWNRKKDLIECLDSIHDQDYPQEKIEVIVFDNDSSDGTGTAVIDLYVNKGTSGKGRVKLLKSGQNIGSYRPFNDAISKIDPRSQFVIGMDDDVILKKNCFRKLIDTAVKYPKAGVIGARSVFFEQPARTACGAGYINWWLAKFSSQDVHELTECDYVIGCCFLFRKDAFIEIGGMDPDYFTTHWEVDFCARIKKLSYKTYYQPEAVVKHKVSPTTHKRSRLYYLYRNKVMFIRKNSPFLPKLLSLFLYIVLWTPKVFLESLVYNRGFNREEMKIILKSVIDGFSGVKGRMGG
jgi:GT2 family glycosyltransferase